MKTMLTGATGYLGRALVGSLVERGEELRLLCRPNADTLGLQGRGVNICRGDILDVASVKRAVDGCERIFHLAAYAHNWAPDPETFRRHNVQGFANVIEAAAKSGVSRVVFTSSGLTLGPSSGCPAEERSPRLRGPYTPYEQSKIEAESLARHAAAGGAPIVIVNPTRVFGPGLLSEANSVTRMISLYLQGRWRLLLGDGGAVGNYAFIDDVVDGHIRAMACGKPGERYLLGGEDITLARFLERVGTLSGRPHRLVPVPAGAALAFGWIEERRALLFGSSPVISPGWVRLFLDDWAASSAKAERELGYHRTPIDVALSRTIAWLRRDGVAWR